MDQYYSSTSCNLIKANIQKCISNIIMDRIQKHIPSLVNDNQSAIILGLLIMGNILCMTITCIMRVSDVPLRLVSKRLMILLTKTFSVLSCLGMVSPYVCSIGLSYVSTATYFIDINAKTYGFFHGHNGLKQSCPLSP
uniref:Uncharacterized protein n=1 Tax=Lactuca sativa TaxID=4236 RepID=A0A9R1XK66_LACSA|nr:hypothetical protein LSAT_V11C400158970 [Lactuca sativa]